MKKIEFIESYRIPDDGGDYQWDDNHGRLIRCKDCKNHRYDADGIPYCINVDYGYGWCDDEYCSKAELRGEQDGND